MQIPSVVVAHPSEDVLEEYAFRRSSESHAARVEEHLLVCPDCCQTLQNIDEFILAMKQYAGKAAPCTVGWSVRVKTIGYGAVLAAAALGLGMATILPAIHHKPAAKPVQLVAFRGGEAGTMIPAEAGAALNLMVDLAELTPSGMYRLQIVDTQGNQVWDGNSRASGGALKMRMSPGLRRGVYWIRLYSAGELVREFGLRAQ